jgi:murein DD-endopeptidase MepM/ murein hydrolase activator NlpD
LRIIERAARREGIDPSILYGLWGAESGFNPGGGSSPTSSAGAQGPFQFMPATAQSYGIDPLNFKQAAFAAAKYLAQYKDRGLAGMLAAYNAGPAGNPNNPETQNYIKKVPELAKQWPGGGGGSNNPNAPDWLNDLANDNGSSVRGGGGGNTDAFAAPLPSGEYGALIGVNGQGGGGEAPSGGSEGIAALLGALTQPKAQAASMGLAPPAFSAQAVTPNGYAPVVSGGGPQQGPDIGGLLEAIQTAGGSVPTQGQPEIAPDMPTGRPPKQQQGPAGAVADPGFDVIGTPGKGTHTIGNWQSDNALDISMPNGTPVRVPNGAVVEKVAGQYEGGASRFDGFQVTVRLKNGQRLFFTHLMDAKVKPGQKLKGGQVIGSSGSANGVPHLHFGVEQGDPHRFYR